MRNFLIALPLTMLPLTIMAGGAWAQDSATATDNCANHLNTSPNPTVGAMLNCLAEMQRTIDRLEAAASTPPALSSSDIAAVITELKTNHADDIKGEKGDAGEPGQVGADGSPGRDGNDALIPVGAVMAFDLPEGCPDGWTRFEAGSGRMIVGVGKRVGVEGSFQLLADSNGSVYQTGGAETHKLTENQLPSHSHDLRYFFSDTVGNKQKTIDSGLVPRPFTGLSSSGRWTSDWIPGSNDDWPPLVKSTRDGAKADSHNNMPPYIALYFCEKQ